MPVAKKGTSLELHRTCHGGLWTAPYAPSRFPAHPQTPGMRMAVTCRDPQKVTFRPNPFRPADSLEELRVKCSFQKSRG